VAHECERKLGSAKSDRVQEKRWADCERSAEAAQKAVTLYDDFSYLYRCVLGELNVCSTATVIYVIDSQLRRALKPPWRLLWNN
jgi:hypothetical protein